MERNVFTFAGKLLRTEQAEPECGEDFCDKCGDCLYCYGGDLCHIGETDQHFWVEYEQERPPRCVNEKCPKRKDK